MQQRTSRAPASPASLLRHALLVSTFVSIATLPAGLSAQSGARYDSIGAGCAGNGVSPELSSLTLPASGQPFRLQMTGLPKDRQAVLWTGFVDPAHFASTLPFDLAGLGARGCMVRILPDHALPFWTGAGGTAQVGVVLPANPSLQGLAFFQQALLIHPEANRGGFLLTSAYRGSVGPHGAQLRTSITQHGITWTFDRPVPTGQFVNGDWWVVGPVKVSSVSPSPIHGSSSARHGSMVDPVATNNTQGYDARAQNYDDKLSVRYPLSLKGGQSLVSTISNESLTNKEIFSHFETVRGAPRTAAVLTVLDAPASPRAFRPPYVGGKKPIYTVDQLKTNLLPKLSKSGISGLPKIDDIARIFARPWLDHQIDWIGRYMHPNENMPGYGREVARGSGFGAVMLCLDYTDAEKRALLIGYVQTGIDLYHTVLAGGGWPANGGHGSGRKLPILIAGLLLGDSNMLGVKARFGEDEQTYYGKGWTGASVLFRIRIPTSSEPEHETTHPSNWSSAQASGEDYRRCCTSLAWVGGALAAHHLGLVKAWNHDPFFDYVDRWMTEVDNSTIQAAIAQSPLKSIAIQSGTVWDGWVKDAWKAHRGKITPLGPK